MMAYLDNAATTQVLDCVAEAVTDAMTVHYGNPSSMHTYGFDAEQRMKQVKEIIAKQLKAQPKEIVFTSGGTESNNMAIIGSAMANRRMGNHIITTSIEHASVYNPMIYLEDMGFTVTYLPVNEKGLVELPVLQEALQQHPDTILVSVMYVNNEVGAVQPIKEIGETIKQYNENIVFHVDAIQAFKKIDIIPKNLKIDLLSVSGHKIHAPKGSGFLYIKDKTKIKPLILGGGQQNDMRSGTENVPAILGLGEAVTFLSEHQDEYRDRMNRLKERLIKGVSDMEDVINNSGDAPHIVSLTFKGIRSEVLLHALEEREVYVSAGSACSSNHPQISGTLKAMKLGKDAYDSTLRFSFSYFTTEEDVDCAIDALHELVPALRKFIRR
ncbi:MAG: cysteine desulfurase family protein [Lachnospiraceae bacterium]